MSAKITLGSTLGGLILLIIIGVIVITGSKVNEENAVAAKQQSEQNNIDIKKLNKTITSFIDRWQERVQISNKVQNSTQDKIEQAVSSILDNLTSHRVVTNQSNEDIQKLINQTSALTGPEYEKLADKRVDSIVGNLSEDHEIIFKALNISKTDKTTDAENDTENLGELFKEFIESQKNESKGPKS